jgi:SAM-dependent methyltransferase
MARISRLFSRGARRHRTASTVHVPSWFETRRPLSPTVGTAAELYADPDQVERTDSPLQPYLNQPDTIDAIQRDPVPVPATEDREGYYDDRHLAYWLSGVEDMQMIRRLVPDARFDHVLDFGGASGRLTRHIRLADEKARITIADLNVNHVDWIDRYFGPSVRGVKVSPYPYFPLADESVSFCVGLSVFTHIDSYESGWLAEIHRVLVDGGFALMTIHSEETWPIMPLQPFLLERLQRLPDFAAAFRPGEPMQPGRQVFTWNPNSIEHNCNVFMDSDYVRKRWSRWFEVVDIAHRAHHDFQAAVILRKTRR